MFYLATLTLGLTYFTAQVVIEAMRRLSGDLDALVRNTSRFHPSDTLRPYQLSREALHNLKHPRP